MIVVDASVLVVALGDDDDSGHRARTRLRGQQLVAPELIDLEVLSAWRRLAASGSMSAERERQAVADLSELRIRRVGHHRFLDRCWELRDNVTIYDAAYVALAEQLEVTLVTADARLGAAPGPHCPIEFLA